MFDDIDLEIISELIEDARKPFSEIARNIGISTQTVIRRFNELRRNEKILHTSITIDPRKLGYIGVARFFMNSNPGTDLSETLKKLKKTPGVFIVTKSIGAFEGYAVMLFKNFRDLSEKIESIKKYPNLGRIEVALSKKMLSHIPIKLDVLSPYKQLIKSK